MDDSVVCTFMGVSSFFGRGGGGRGGGGRMKARGAGGRRRPGEGAGGGHPSLPARGYGEAL